ncbi:capsule biosynthesis protein [Thalassococcus sp. BH17M4-6]|uniref:capsule biosynthesis protein n=1 Tax=Thalassococcus sp. BH17M4-6 TaxID=3413148 RepID=UPI003BD5236E
MTSPVRAFLFLQSHPSFFGRAVIRDMRAKGQTCHVVNLTFGDWFFRMGIGAVNYRGSLANWRAWLGGFLERYGITDIVYYADQRPYHRIASEVAEGRGIACYAYEFGYLRPDFITLERTGMGVRSHFPADPKVIEDLAAKVDHAEPDGHYPYGFSDEAPTEVFYHLGSWLLSFLYPGYVRDRRFNPVTEYLSYLPKLAFRKGRARHARAVTDQLCRQDTPFNLVLLQMQGDYQVRWATRYESLDQFATDVITSFCVHAPPDRHLVFKLHPLENGLRDWAGLIRKTAARLGLPDRVHVIDGGDLIQLIDRCEGVVTMNSTAGLTALQRGAAVCTMGIAVYDMPRMTHQTGLDAFWTDPQPPVPSTVAAFRRLLIAAIQIKGNFLTPSGRARAVPEFSRRLIERDVNRHGCFVTPPPRLARAHAMGVPTLPEWGT